jgi:hypothetical protein
MNSDTKRFLGSQMMWIAISLAISFAISMILPFPISLVVIVGFFLGMSYFMRRVQMRRMGTMGSRGGFGGMFGGGSEGVNYVCIACGHRFKGGSCPRCGSKMKKADF